MPKSSAAAMAGSGTFIRTSRYGAAVGIWFRDLPLLPGERLVWQVACNWQQRRVARGGRLGLTSQALIFEPNRIDGLMGGKSRRLPLTDIASVAMESGGVPNSPMSGGIRRRMRLTLTNGASE